MSKKTQIKNNQIKGDFSSQGNNVVDMPVSNVLKSNYISTICCDRALEIKIITAPTS